MRRFFHQEMTAKKVFHRLLIFYLILLLVAGSFISGLLFSRTQSPKDKNSDGSARILNKDARPKTALQEELDFRLFWQVWDAAREKHISQPVDDSRLFYGSIAGIVASLDDPYSVFYSPKMAEEFKQELDGKFEGIGAEVGIKNGILTIIAPLSESPAERAGLLAGDKVVAIDGESTSFMALDAAVSKIRGPRGTVVTLSVVRNGFTKPKDFAITRDEIVVVSVRLKMVDGIAHISLVQFNEETRKKFDKVVRDALGGDAKGIILDLRNNPGGFLDVAVTVAGEWVKGETIVIERMADGTEKPYRSDGRGRLSKKKTVVLINQGSASASEIVAGALQDYGKATLVGKKTFGKGSVQDYEEFPNGSALKLTIAEWLTPKERSINREGIVPDVEIDLTEEDYNADRDPQLEKALEIIRQQ